MQLYESAEDYLERILMLKEKLGTVRSIDIAIDMNYSKASISRAIKKLKEANYITVDVDGHINFTELGYETATKIYERHKVLTALFEHLGVDKETASIDACKVEHDISDQTFEALKKINLGK